MFSRSKRNELNVKLLNTYDDRDDAEQLLKGKKRLASERDSTIVIYNLFGQPSWGNFHRLKTFNLGELSTLWSAETAGLWKKKADTPKSSLC
jgi:hypothetical protein